MTVYARSDVASVSIGSAHGGCGHTHSRPVVEGAPVALWELTCPACEDFLRHDPLWASTIPEIPETPDETTQREDWDKRGTYDQQNVMAVALARLAGVELPESMRRLITGTPAHLATITATLVCPAGHENPAAAKFCGECGTALQQPVPAAQLPAGDTPTVDGPSPATRAEQQLEPDAATQPPAKQPAAKKTAAADGHACKTCGGPVERKGGKGRWPTQCDSCKAA